MDQVSPSSNSLEQLSPRQREVLAAVQQQGFVTIEALARQFDVSAQTVRRDIIVLEKAHFLQRFHGGAGLRDSSVRLGYTQKQFIAVDGKERIGRAVAEMIPEGASVFLDVGSTVEAVARALLDKQALQVFTCSAAVAMIFADHPRIEVFLTGGLLRGPNGSLVGDVTIQQISLFEVDFSVTSFAGFDLERHAYGFRHAEDRGAAGESGAFAPSHRGCGFFQVRLHRCGSGRIPVDFRCPCQRCRAARTAAARLC
ncbi:MAG: DeoR/GlpR family DNA-binding transcription regulator [Paracoccus aminovorans]|nr:DeoR/GlpR family DNA-binding transcription regulator [Paracoccus aminovorans]